MFIPLVSVSLIGLVVALRRGSVFVDGRPLALAGLVGAWVGFLTFGLLGVLVDVVLFGHFWPTLIGHVGALLVARRAVGTRSRSLPVRV